MGIEHDKTSVRADPQFIVPSGIERVDDALVRTRQMKGVGLTGALVVACEAVACADPQVPFVVLSDAPDTVVW